MTRAKTTTKRRAPRLAAIALVALASCGGSSAPREGVVAPIGRAPLALESLGDAAPLLAARARDLVTPFGAARAAARFGDATLYATAAGLFARDGATWLAIDRAGAKVDDALDLAPRHADGAREAWVRTSRGVARLRLEGGRASWFDVAVPASVGPIRAMAALDDRLALATDRGVAVVDGSDVRLVRASPGSSLAPDAMAGSGAAAWIAWSGAIVRTDGVAWTVLARDLPLGPGARVFPDDDDASAIVVDARGAAWRVVARPSIDVTGLRDGARVVDTRLALDVAAGPATALAEVDYALDDRPLAKRTSAPWGWGASGDDALDLGKLAFGAHHLRVDARTARGERLARTIAFDYAAPAGGVPSYARDVAPLYAARCASCHDLGGARDLSGYDALRKHAGEARELVRARKMPPDFALDDADTALITAWVDGNSPP